MMPQDAGYPDPANNPAPARPDVNPIAGRIEPTLPPRDTGTPPGLSASPDALNLLKALRRRWMMAVALGGTLASIAAAAAWFLMAPEPTAFATFRVSSIPISLSEDKQPSTPFPTYMKTLGAQLRSRPVIMAALQHDEVKRLNLESLAADPAQYLEEKLKVDFQDGNEMLTVMLSGADAGDAVTIVKAITAAFMDQVVYNEKRVRATRFADLDHAVNETSEAIKTKTANLDLLGKQNGINPKDGLSQQQAAQIENFKDARAALRSVEFDLLKEKANLKALDDRIAALQKIEPTDLDVDAKLKADPEAIALRQQIQKLKELDSYYKENRVDPTEPTWKVARGKLKALIAELETRKIDAREELKSRRDNQNSIEAPLARLQIQTGIDTLEKEKVRLDEGVKLLAADVERIGKSNNEMEFLKKEIAGDNAQLARIAGQRDLVKLDQSSPPRIAVYQEAELLKKDIRKQVLATVAAPIVVWLTVCVGLAWLEYRQRKIHSAGEVARGLGIRVVGSVPKLPNLERHIVGVGDPDLDGHPVLESIDAIRTLVLHDAATQGTRVVMVTSAVEGEGKTTLAAHLASSLARAGRKTLLMDADLRQPAVHQLFELPMQPGFSEVLLGEVEVADSVQATTLDGLSVITAGQWDREVILSLARDGGEGIFERLREEFDFIIVDSHPVLTATDALLIGQQSDAVILSVMRQVSQMPRVYGAAQRLTALKIRVLGAVINGADAEDVIPSVESHTPAQEMRA